jgi:hypothetical protein
MTKEELLTIRRRIKMLLNFKLAIDYLRENGLYNLHNSMVINRNLN